MKLDCLKEKKELVSVVLLGASVFFAVLILVKVTGFFAASAKAESLVKTAIEQNNTDPNDMDKYFAKYKVLADALKKNNLFVPPAEKQHPVQEVLGILGNEVLIKDKWYEVGDTVGEAKIVAIGPTQATIEWDGKEKTFAPIDASDPSQPGGPRSSRAAAKSSESKGGSAQMVAVQSQGRATDLPKVAIEKMTERFKNMSEPERDKFMTVMKEQKEEYKKMSEAEKIQFKSEMIEKFSGGGPDGGKQGGK
jgi:hypothetical protein